MTIFVDGSTIESLSTSLSPVSAQALTVESLYTKDDIKGVVTVQGSDMHVLFLNPVGPVTAQGATIEVIRAEPIKPVNVDGLTVEVLHNMIPVILGAVVEAVTIEVLRAVTTVKKRGPMNVLAN